jgi:hypothetical protein
MKVSVLVLATSLATIAAHSQPSVAPPSSPFDGAWTVRIACPSNTEDSGAKGYAYEFPATVANGFLSGSHGVEGTAGSLHIEGSIPFDGNALLHARGRTGNPEYAAQKPAPGTAYSYSIKAHFESTNGTGTRTEARICNFIFKR